MGAADRSWVLYKHWDLMTCLETNYILTEAKRHLVLLLYYFQYAFKSLLSVYTIDKYNVDIRYFSISKVRSIFKTNVFYYIYIYLKKFILLLRHRY